MVASISISLVSRKRADAGPRVLLQYLSLFLSLTDLGCFCAAFEETKGFMLCASLTFTSSKPATGLLSVICGHHRLEPEIMSTRSAGNDCTSILGVLGPLSVLVSTAVQLGQYTRVASFRGCDLARWDPSYRNHSKQSKRKHPPFSTAANR